MRDHSLTFAHPFHNGGLESLDGGVNESRFLKKLPGYDSPPPLKLGKVFAIFDI
jgi:hypothetical protein